MLELDSDKRINAEGALAHPYLAQYADPTDEPSSPPYDQTFEELDYDVNQWKGERERDWVTCNQCASIVSLHCRIRLERGPELSSPCRPECLIVALSSHHSMKIDLSYSYIEEKTALQITEE